MTQAQVEKAFVLELAPDSFDGVAEVILRRLYHRGSDGLIACSYRLEVLVSQDWGEMIQRKNVPVSEKILTKFFG